MSNNFDGPVIIDTIGATNYFGFGRSGTATDSTGPRIYNVPAAPTVAAPAGSLALSSNGGLYFNTDGTLAGWQSLSAAAGAGGQFSSGVTEPVPANVSLVAYDPAAGPMTSTLPQIGVTVPIGTKLTLRRPLTNPTNLVTVQGTGGQTIDGAVTVTMIPGGSRQLIATSVGWVSTVPPQVLTTSVAGVNPANILAGATGTTAVTVNGARPGDRVQVQMDVLEAGLAISNAYVSAANTVTLVLANVTAAPIDAAAQDVTLELTRPNDL
jgi:hypothetical protein